MALSHELCATQILNISRPPGWLDGQKHLRLPPFDARTHSCLAPRVRRNNRTPPQDGLGPALAGALNRIAVSAKPTAKKTNVVAKKVRLRRATHHPIRSRGIGFLPLRIRRVDVTFAGCVRGFDARVWGEVDARWLSPCV